jgi:hypothetical protein
VHHDWINDWIRQPDVDARHAHADQLFPKGMTEENLAARRHPRSPFAADRMEFGKILEGRRPRSLGDPDAVTALCATSSGRSASAAERRRPGTRRRDSAGRAGRLQIHGSRSAPKAAGKP